jgi:DNA-binding response OmpR family regulator
MNRNYKILIVEDEFINREFIKKVLSDFGHTIVGSVTNAKDALRISKDNLIDFIFMDINLKGNTNGITCAEQVDKSIAIIYMTAQSDTTSIEKAGKTNLYGYMIKPFTAQDIKATLTVAIAKFLMCKLKKFTTIELGHKYNYHLNNKTLIKNDIPVLLTKKEHAILDFFVLHINERISFHALKESVWENKDISSSNIRDTVLRLRKKAPLLQIENIIGMGYCLKNV